MVNMTDSTNVDFWLLRQGFTSVTHMILLLSNKYWRIKDELIMRVYKV